MKLLYATSLNYPSRLANRIQTLAMARAFHGLLGDRFVLGIGENAERTALPGAVVESGRAHSAGRALFYLRYAAHSGITHIYCREEKLMFFLAVFSFFRNAPALCYEIHHLKHARSWWHRLMLGRVRKVVSITAAMRDELMRAHGYRGEALVAHDAVDAALFDIPVSKKEARRTLGLPFGTKIVLYAGSLELWKGVGTFYESSKHLDSSYLLLVIGGKPAWVDEFKGWYPETPQVRMLGEKDYATELPLYLRASDAAVLPNTGKEEISRISTSPLKMFAYMAAGTPIVASDLPSLREVLSQENAVLVTPDDTVALAEGIRSVFADEDGARARAARARADVRAYSWDVRATSILSFLDTRP